MLIATDGEHALRGRRPSYQPSELENRAELGHGATPTRLSSRIPCRIAQPATFDVPGREPRQYCGNLLDRRSRVHEDAELRFDDIRYAVDLGAHDGHADAPELQKAEDRRQPAGTKQ